MGSIVIDDLVATVMTVDLKDPAGDRFDAATVREWANEAIREMVSLKPDVHVEEVTLSLAAGWSQHLPAGSVQLMAVLCNKSGEAVSMIDRRELDALDPAWRQADKAKVVEHVMHTEAAPTRYDVYPPNNGQGKLMAEVSTIPAAMSEGNAIPVGDEYEAVILAGMRWRAYKPDGDGAYNTQKANENRTLFLQGLGLKDEREAREQPRPRGEASGR